jgi:hypothetical protein
MHRGGDCGVLNIRWWDPIKGCQAVNGRVKNGGEVQVFSSHHTKRPDGYDIFEVVPRFLRWLPGKKRKWTDTVDVVQDVDKALTSLAWTDVFSLNPTDQRRESKFVAGFNPRSQIGEPFRSAMLRCSSLFIQHRKIARRLGFELRPEVDPTTGSVKLGAAGAHGGRDELFTVEAPVDPPVSIGVIQTEPLVDYLSEVAASYWLDERDQGPDFTSFISEVASYFSTPAVPIEQDSRVAADIPENRLFPIAVGLSGDFEAAAFAIEIRNEATGEQTISDPLFLRRIRDGIVATDMPYEWLDVGSRRLLATAGRQEDPFQFARDLGEPLETVWEKVVQLTEALGLSDVAEATTLAAEMEFGTGMARA